MKAPLGWSDTQCAIIGMLIVMALVLWLIPLG